jgi:16S rRNA (uracil1498-N3)-methyltransferase
MRRFFIATPAPGATHAILNHAEAHHLRDILRMQCGQPIILLDGRGHRYQAQIESVGHAQVCARILAKLEGDTTESPLELTLAQAFLKEKKLDRLIAPLTELGISELVAFCARRSVARPNAAKQRRRVERWRTIAREALKQCGRACLPAIGCAPSLESVLQAHVHDDIRLIFWENATRGLSQLPARQTRPQRIAAIIGPEGGFARSEIEQAQSHGFIPLSLGPRILRAHTAALTVAALLQYQFGDLGGHANGNHESI